MTVRVLVLAQFVETPSWAGFEEGRAAYERVDHPTAFEEWLPLAEQGMPEAQGLLGTTDLAGRGAPQDYVQAEAWFRKAAAQGGPSAQFYLGHLFREGKGVPHNEKEAVRWQPRSAEQDSASAQHSLAITYR